MTTREVSYATFYSPGSFVSEETTRALSEATPAAAVAALRAQPITERYGATPFGFKLSRRIEADPVPDGRGGTLNVTPKTVWESGLHFLGGVVETVDDVRLRGDPKERILVSNMESNEGAAIVCITTSGYRSTHEFGPRAVVVDPRTGAIVERGDTPERIAYRRATYERHVEALRREYPHL